MKQPRCRDLGGYYGRFLLTLVMIVGIFLGGLGQSVARAAQVVTLGGTVTEIVFALDKQDDLIAVDMSSLYPAEARELPQVGYYRQIGVEGLVSIAPSLILASENAGPRESLDKVAQLGIPVVRVSDKGTLASLYERITQVAEALAVSERGEVLLQHVQAQVDEALALPSTPYRATLVVNRTGTLMAAGGETSANELMRLAGFQNIFADQETYKPVSKESFLALQPEVIITTVHSLEANGGLERFISDPVIALTPAAHAGRIVVMDDLLALGMGPRVAEAITQLKSIDGSQDNVTEEAADKRVDTSHRSAVE